MSALTIQNVSQGGLTPSYTAAASGGDTIAAASVDRALLHVKNGGGSSITVTITAQTASAVVPGAGTLTIPNITKTVANGAEAILGPFGSAYRDGSGNVAIGYSAVTSVTVAAYAVPNPA
jgi:hypothetical protein